MNGLELVLKLKQVELAGSGTKSIRCTELHPSVSLTAVVVPVVATMVQDPCSDVLAARVLLVMQGVCHLGHAYLDASLCLTPSKQMS